MAVGVILKLFHGADSLDLNTGRYCVDDQTFSPPTAARSVTFSRSSLGSDAVRKRRANRSWEFALHVVPTGSASKSEAERALRELQSFLDRAGVEEDPLYIVYRAWNDYDYEPYFGLHSAFMRYEVVHGHAEAGGMYNLTVGNSNAVPNISINLTINPQAAGIPMRAGQATGGIFEDYIGKGDSSVKGTIVPEATTNRVPNPAFMHGTYDTNWSTAGTAGLVAAANKDKEYILFGDTSVKLSYSATAADARYVDTITLTGANYILSAYVKARDGSAITASNVQLWYNAQVTPDLYISMGDGWYRLIADISGSAEAVALGVNILENDQDYYVDGIQCEQKATLEVTAFCSGDLLGCAWAGTKNDSNSTRTAGLLRYNFSDVLPGRGGYTIRVAWLPEVAASASNRHFFNDADDDIRAWIKDDEAIVFQVSASNSVTSTVRTYTPGTPMIFHFTWDGDTVTIYEDGSSIGTAGSKVASTSETTLLYVGSTETPHLHLNGTILDFSTFDRAMSSGDVTADHRELTQQIADKERTSPLPYLFSEDGDDIIDNDTDGTLFSYGVIAGLMGDDVDHQFYAVVSSDYSTSFGLLTGAAPVIPRHFDRDIVTIGSAAGEVFFDNRSGSSDAAANNNEFSSVGVGSGSATIAATGTRKLIADVMNEVEEVYAAVVLKESSNGDTLQLRLSLEHGGDNERLQTPWRSVTSDATYRAFVLGPVSISFDENIMDSSRVLGVNAYGRRGTGGSTGPVAVSHMVLLPNYSGVDMTVTTSGVNASFVRDRIAELVVTGTSTTQTRGTRFFNAPLKFKANRQNVLMVQTTYDNYTGTTAAWTSGINHDFQKFSFTPRFDIL